jgi:hypothetical protein
MADPPDPGRLLGPTGMAPALDDPTSDAGPLTSTLCPMCRNIRNLHNFAPPASQEEVRDAALQYVRKISGFTKPSRANEAAFERAVDAVAHATMHLLDDLVSNAPPKDREVEAAKRRARAAERYAA